MIAKRLHTSTPKLSVFTPHTAIEPPQFYKERQYAHVQEFQPHSCSLLNIAFETNAIMNSLSFRSEHDIEVNLNEEGLPIAPINGEEVVIPELQRTLEFTLDHPVMNTRLRSSPVAW